MKYIILYIYLLFINIVSCLEIGCCNRYGIGSMGIKCCHKYFNATENECLKFSLLAGGNSIWNNSTCH